MRWQMQRLLGGALALSAAALTSSQIGAQATLTLVVEDSGGAVVGGATIEDAAGHHLGLTDAQGRLTLECSAPCAVRVSALGFDDKRLQLSVNAIVRLQPASTNEEVTVTAYRAPLGALESPTDSRLLSQTALETTPTVTLDGEIRQLPGVELFRRSSSLVANPSSQGVSLRGLGSTSASRTLVTEDDVPLNDAFGGWIHWEEQPELSIQRIEVVRGGASDLYGSSAIGGVIGLTSVRPTSDLAQLRTSYGSEGTYDDNLRLQSKHGPWGIMATGGILGTDGYIQEAPWQRGPVDIASNVHSQNGIILTEHDKSALRLFIRGSGFNEARNNGTPLQTNGTRLWRYATGGDWHGPRTSSLGARLYGSTEHYRQTFSQIANPTSLRNGETLTKFSLTPNNELGAAVHWNQPLGAGLLLVSGADVHDVRVWDREMTYGNSTLTNLHDHQRDSAVYGELMWVHNAWTLVAGGRIDWFQNYDGRQWIWTGSNWEPSATQPAQTSQQVFDPRLGLTRKLWNHWAISSSGFRAFRAPTPNELYRSTQVGNQLTTPNGVLLSERATGWEAGLATEWRWGTIRSSYFLTQVNRPITAVTINGESSPILLKRENLGQIESRGVSLDFTLAPRNWLSIDGGYQHAHAIVSQGNEYVSNWIPEVARNVATLNARAYRQRFGTLNLQGRMSGRQFDNAANTSLLHGYFRLDAYVSHDFGKRTRVFAAGENLFDRKIEVAKTPTTTLSMPRVARIGFEVRLGGNNR